MNALTVGMCIGGVVFTAAGVLFYMGIWKYWFLADYVHVIAAPFRVYLTLPTGVAMFLLAWELQFPSMEASGGWGLYGACITILIGVVVAALRPRYLVPRWIKWLEREHKSIVPLLIEEGRKMGRLNWQARVWTQKGLEEWIEEVQCRHGLI